jgi:hypothetical protein
VRKDESVLLGDESIDFSVFDLAFALLLPSGAASIEVRAVRQIGLEVEQDSANHANILGLPHREDNLAEAERVAGLLARKSQVFWQPS